VPALAAPRVAPARAPLACAAAADWRSQRTYHYRLLHNCMSAKRHASTNRPRQRTKCCKRKQSRQCPSSNCLRAALGHRAAIKCTPAGVRQAEACCRCICSPHSITLFLQRGSRRLQAKKMLRRSGQLSAELPAEGMGRSSSMLQRYKKAIPSVHAAPAGSADPPVPRQELLHLLC